MGRSYVGTALTFLATAKIMIKCTFRYITFAVRPRKTSIYTVIKLATDYNVSQRDAAECSIFT